MLNCPPVITRNSIVDLVYPVGSYFITESSDFDTVAKVQAHFGGTWVQVKGRFLYGSTSAGTQGGSNDAKVISHSHTFTGNAITGHTGVEVDITGAPSGAFSTGNSNIYKRACNGTSGVRYDGYNCYFNATPSGTISTEGESATGANMPAYRTVYMYRRTA